MRSHATIEENYNEIFAKLYFLKYFMEVIASNFSSLFFSRHTGELIDFSD